MADRLRGLWDFADLEGSEARLGAQLEREPDHAGRAEVLTQLARVDLERGRLLRSGGDPAAAFPLFERAFYGSGRSSTTSAGTRSRRTSSSRRWTASAAR